MHYRWITILALTLINVLSGCANDPTFRQQQAWLEQNYPDRSRSIKKLPYPSDQFRQQIIAGEIANGMYLDQVLIATDSDPYGPRSVEQLFWCTEQEVTECDNTCNPCNSIFLTRKLAILLSGNGQLMQVIEHRLRSAKEPITLYQGIHFSLARHTFRVLGNLKDAQH